MATTKTKQRRTIRVDQAKINSLRFHMMPADGGQIVEVTYACDEDGVWCSVYDRGDRTQQYQFAKYYARASEAALAFEPQNGRLPRHNQWVDVVVG